MEVVKTRKYKQESAPETRKNVVAAIVTPLLKIVQVNQGVTICVIGSP